MGGDHAGPVYNGRSSGETEEDFRKTVRFILDHKDRLDVINLYPMTVTPGSDFSLTRERPESDTLIRLKFLINVCRNNGIKVCVGTQSAEYVLFKRVYPDDNHKGIADNETTS